MPDHNDKDKITSNFGRLAYEWSDVKIMMNGKPIEVVPIVFEESKYPEEIRPAALFEANDMPIEMIIDLLEMLKESGFTNVSITHVPEATKPVLLATMESN